MKPEEMGKLIEYHRKRGKLSRLELANLAGVGKTVVYDIEKGKETIQLKSLLNVLRVLNIQLRLEPPFESEKDQ